MFGCAACADKHSSTEVAQDSSTVALREHYAKCEVLVMRSACTRSGARAFVLVFGDGASVIRLGARNKRGVSFLETRSGLHESTTIQHINKYTQQTNIMRTIHAVTHTYIYTYIDR